MNWRGETEREDDGRWIGRVPELSGALALGANHERGVADGLALAWRVLVGRLEDSGESELLARKYVIIGVSRGNKMATATQSQQVIRTETEPIESNAVQRPIWETIAEIGTQISDEEWEKVPEDASINYKQHLYGAPAKDQ